MRDAGYYSESHFVTTEDGYILNLYHIMKTPNPPKGLEVVYMQHGILDTADTWIFHHKDVAPAYQLLEAGYDVWLGNSRGNRYSKNHKTLVPSKDKEYWLFSFHEMALYDIPAEISFVL